MVSESKRYIAGNVLCQWISLVANLVMMVWVTNLLASLFAGTVDRNTLLATLGLPLERWWCDVFAPPFPVEWGIWPPAR